MCVVTYLSIMTMGNGKVRRRARRGPAINQRKLTGSKAMKLNLNTTKCFLNWFLHLFRIKADWREGLSGTSGKPFCGKKWWKVRLRCESRFRLAYVLCLTRKVLWKLIIFFRKDNSTKTNGAQFQQFALYVNRVSFAIRD